MNIIIYHHSPIAPSKGGISRMAEFHYITLTTAGHNVWYLTAKKGSTTLSKQLFIEGNTCEEQRLSFANIIKELGIALIIYQDGIAPRNNHILKWSKENGVKIINVVHSSLRGIYNFDSCSTFSVFLPSFIRKIANKSVNIYFKHRYGSLYREMFELSDKVVLLSDKFRDEISWFSGLPTLNKIQAITNPLPFSELSVSFNNKKKQVVHVGSLTMVKRQDLLLKVWKRVEAQRYDWQLLIIGDGVRRQPLEKLAQDLKLQHVQFLGYQNPNMFYEESSIFCLTSSTESFGLVVVESMAYGCVPLAFNSYETASDIIDNGENGFLISPFNINEYVNKLIWLMDHEEIRQQMGMNAVQKSKVFNKDKIGQQWIKLVENMKK